MTLLYPRLLRHRAKLLAAEYKERTPSTSTTVGPSPTNRRCSLRLAVPGSTVTNCSSFATSSSIWPRSPAFPNRLTHARRFPSISVSPSHCTRKCESRLQKLLLATSGRFWP